MDERIQSERFKAELITNVSHDLKTPLTSIINYVDLLKKQDIDNPKAQEYIEVLDRKSQRLKKLTEDLVEASKASTGSLSVHLDRLGMVQLVQQALGEFEVKFAQSRLTVVPAFPEEECSILADGRHLWRVIDNLLSNCNKYALEGTRIYVEVCRWEGKVVLSIKNISRQPLNIPAERLMLGFGGDDDRLMTLRSRIRHGLRGVHPSAGHLGDGLVDAETVVLGDRQRRMRGHAGIDPPGPPAEGAGVLALAQISARGRAAFCLFLVACLWHFCVLSVVVVTFGGCRPLEPRREVTREDSIVPARRS